MTGSSQDDYANMMLAGGRSVEGNRSKWQGREAGQGGQKTSGPANSPVVFEILRGARLDG